jgi:DNA-binding transcriptional LysR family regulator
VLREPLQVVCAPDHPRAGKRVKRLAELRGERWIAFPAMRGRREVAAAHVFALFLTQGLGEVEWTAVDSLTAQKRLVEAGFGLALLARSHMVEELRAGLLATIAVGDLAADQDIVLVTRRGGFLSAAAQRLLETIRRDYAASDVSAPRDSRKRTPARKGIARRRLA